MTRSAHMFWLSWERKLRCGGIFSKQGHDFFAQKQFLANIEDTIASSFDIPSSISRYQKTLQYASAPLDFVFGIWLYPSPSDSALHPGNIQGYNNKIQLAGSDAAIGHNLGINEALPIANKGDKAFQGKVASPAGTVHNGSQPSQNKTSSEGHDRTSAEKRPSATAHEEQKTSLVAVGVAGGLSALWLSSRKPVPSSHMKQSPTAMAKAYKFSASQVAVFPNELKSHETIEPMIPGRAAAVLPAKLARARPRACRCFFTHSLKSFLSGGSGAGAGECKHKGRDRLADGCENRCDGKSLLTKQRANALSQCGVFMEEPSECLADSVDLGPEGCSARREDFEHCLSFKLDVREYTLELSDSVSNLSPHFSVVCFRQFSMLLGEVSFDLGFSVVDTRQLCQVVSNSSLTPVIVFSSPAYSLLAWGPTRCRLADHQSSSGRSQLVLRCWLCRGGPRIRYYQGCPRGFICLLERF